MYLVTDVTYPPPHAWQDKKEMVVGVIVKLSTDADEDCPVKLDNGDLYVDFVLPLLHCVTAPGSSIECLGFNQPYSLLS